MRFPCIMRASAAAALAALALLPAAASAAPWAPPRTLSSPHEFVDPVTLTFASDGAGLAAWSWQDGTNAGARAGSAAATLTGAEHRLFAPRKASLATTLAGVTPDGPSRAIRATVVRRHLDPLRADAFRLRAATGPMGGAYGPGRVVATGPQMLRVTVGGNAPGDAAIAWWERTNRSSRLFVATRRAGHRFGRPVRLAAHGFGDVAVAVSPHGAVLVAWETGAGTIRTRTKRAGSRRFGPAVQANAGRARNADLAAGLSTAGRAVVAWAAQRRSAGGTTGPVTYAAAIRRPHGHRFAEQVLERRPPDVLAQPIRLVVERTGRATVAWAGLAGIRVSTADADAPFGTPQDVSTPGARVTMGDLAAGRSRRVVVWVEGDSDDGSGRVMAAYAGVPAALFGAPETVAAGPAARVPRVAIDPASGRPTAVWSERPPGVTGTVARAAARTG